MWLIPWASSLHLSILPYQSRPHSLIISYLLLKEFKLASDLEALSPESSGKWVPQGVCLDQNEEEKAWYLPSPVTKLWGSWVDSMDSASQRWEISVSRMLNYQWCLRARSSPVRIRSYKGIMGQIPYSPLDVLEGSRAWTSWPAAPIPQQRKEKMRLSPSAQGEWLPWKLPFVSVNHSPSLSTLLPALEAGLINKKPFFLPISQWRAPVRDEKKRGVCGWGIYYSWLPLSGHQITAPIRRSCPSILPFSLPFSNIATIMVPPYY